MVNGYPTDLSCWRRKRGGRGRDRLRGGWVVSFCVPCTYRVSITSLVVCTYLCTCVACCVVLCVLSIHRSFCRFVHPATPQNGAEPLCAPYPHTHTRAYTHIITHTFLCAYLHGSLKIPEGERGRGERGCCVGVPVCVCSLRVSTSLLFLASVPPSIHPFGGQILTRGAGVGVCEGEAAAADMNKARLSRLSLLSHHSHARLPISLFCPSHQPQLCQFSYFSYC
mmetsp:Transcript_25904/g.64335  ORF Transcript_25904/g.64335 Transcript_25904/m.64335 type:complete len:224 (+) Transcript_25904:970-1641(+)